MPDRIMAMASTGGHFIQLKCIMKQILEVSDVDITYVRTKISADDMPQDQHEQLIADFSRDNWWRGISTFFVVIKLVRKIQPSHVISTGAMPGLVTMLVARLLGKKAIWVDSIANTRRLSASGRFAKHIAHLTLTQWENVVQPGVEFQGRVIL